VVKTIGDAVMATFSTPDRAPSPQRCACARRLACDLRQHITVSADAITVSADAICN
jgi:class 3 adenylate cyclase